MSLATVTTMHCSWGINERLSRSRPHSVRSSVAHSTLPMNGSHRPSCRRTANAETGARTRQRATRRDDDLVSGDAASSSASSGATSLIGGRIARSASLADLPCGLRSLPSASLSSFSGRLSSSDGLSLTLSVNPPTLVTTFLTWSSMAENFSTSFGRSSSMALRPVFSEGISGILSARRDREQGLRRRISAAQLDEDDAGDALQREAGTGVGLDRRFLAQAARPPAPGANRQDR